MLSRENKRGIFEQTEKTNLRFQMIAKHKRKSESDYCVPWGVCPKFSSFSDPKSAIERGGE